MSKTLEEPDALRKVAAYLYHGMQDVARDKDWATEPLSEELCHRLGYADDEIPLTKVWKDVRELRGEHSGEITAQDLDIAVSHAREEINAVVNQVGDDVERESLGEDTPYQDLKLLLYSLETSLYLPDEDDRTSWLKWFYGVRFLRPWTWAVFVGEPTVHYTQWPELKLVAETPSTAPLLKRDGRLEEMSRLAVMRLILLLGQKIEDRGKGNADAGLSFLRSVYDAETRTFKKQFIIVDEEADGILRKEAETAETPEDKLAIYHGAEQWAWDHFTSHLSVKNSAFTLLAVCEITALRY